MNSVDLLDQLVRINSVNAFYPGGPGEAQCADRIEQFWRSHGIECWRQNVLPGRDNVIARIPGQDASKRLVLEAHMDTVSVEGMTIDPFDSKIVDGCMYGRGACDTKAGLASMMCAAVHAFRDPIPPPAEIWMAAVVDEEFSCQGVLRLCQGLTATAAVVAEPTEMRLVIASKGVLRWRIVSRGRSAHSSKVHLGFNAIHPMAKLLVAIENEHAHLDRLSHPLLGPSTANVGMISGGVQVNFVPDQCAIEIDRRLLPYENVDEVLASYQRIIDRVASAVPEARFEMESPILIDRGLDTSPDATIVQTAGRVLKQLGENPEPSGVAFGSDASKLMLAGVDSILFGPGSIDQAHAAVEYVEIEQVLRAEQFYYALIREFGK